MKQREVIFKILKNNKQKAFEYIKKELLKDKNSSYEWVDKEEIKKSKNLIDIFRAFRWGCEVDKEGNIDYLFFMGEKIGSEIIFFNKISPFVEKGCFIEMIGEDGVIWRWKFKKDSCVEIVAKLIFKD